MYNYTASATYMYGTTCHIGVMHLLYVGSTADVCACLFTVHVCVRGGTELLEVAPIFVLCVTASTHSAKVWFSSEQIHVCIRQLQLSGGHTIKRNCEHVRCTCHVACHVTCTTGVLNLGALQACCMQPACIVNAYQMCMYLHVTCVLYSD